jgi:hypothetical protein
MLRHAFMCLFFLTCASWGWTAETDKPDTKPTDQASVAAVTVTDPSKVMVVVTPTGTKYHTKDCRSAKTGKEETLKQALADGLEPCALCHPPIYDPTKIVVYDGGGQGKKYHTKDCKFAKGEITLAKAQEEGLEPCKLCNPPPLPVVAPDKASKSTDDAPKPAK